MKAAWFRQKAMVAMISSILFVLLLMGESDGRDDFFVGYTVTLTIMMTYGLFASFVSDWLSDLLVKNRFGKHIISGFFHCAAGMILWFFGAVAATIFFFVDRVLMWIPMKWTYVMILGIPSIVVWTYTIFKYYIPR